jgi:hypothetical protein
MLQTQVCQFMPYDRSLLCARKVLQNLRQTNDGPMQLPAKWADAIGRDANLDRLVGGKRGHQIEQALFESVIDGRGANIGIRAEYAAEADGDDGCRTSQPHPAADTPGER